MRQRENEMREKEIATNTKKRRERKRVLEAEPKYNLQNLSSAAAEHAAVVNRNRKTNTMMEKSSSLPFSTIQNIGEMKIMIL